MRSTLFIVLVLFTAMPAAASPFDDVVSAFEKSTTLDRQYIPFMGIARTFVRVTGYHGVHDFRIAVFEQKEVAQARRVDIGAVDRLVGPGWQKFISTRERGGDDTTIFAKPEGELLRMMIVTVEADQATVIEVKVEPEKAGEYVNREHRHAR